MGEGGVIKSVVIFLLLAVFSLVAGSMVADSAKEAIIPALLVAGVSALIYLGKNCWWLIFIAPPVISAFGFMPNMPVGYGVCAIVLLYWLLLSFLGHARLTWNGVKGLDIVTLILVLYFLSTWVRHPVTINAFTSIYDEGDVNIGGQDYIWCVGAVVFYLTLSLITLSLSSVIKLLKIAFWLLFLVLFFQAVKESLFSSPPVLSNSGEETDMRSFPFFTCGVKLSEFLFAKYAIVGILISPYRLVLLLAAVYSIAKAGFRSPLLTLFVYAGVSSFFHRQIFYFLGSVLVAWMVLVGLSRSHVLSEASHGVQRVMTVLPGAYVGDSNAKYSAQSSLDWRKELWALGWNPKSGYIKDYVWGDGYGLAKSYLKRNSVLYSRGELGTGDLDYYAKSGMWHHGGLSVIHRTGYVGVAVLALWMLCCSFISARCCLYARVYQEKEYIYMLALPLIGSPLLFWGSATGWYFVFAANFYGIAIVKVIYSLMIREGVMSPCLSHNIYVPMIQRVKNAG